MDVRRLSRRGLVLAGVGLVVGCTAGKVGGPAASRRAAAARSPLPAPTLDRSASLYTALSQRRSIRAFAPQPLGRAELGQLMWAAQGVTHGPGYRTAPSAGALYPLELYTATRDATLHYLPAHHQVEQWPPGQTWQDLVASTPSTSAVAAAQAVFVVTGVLHRTQAKYGGRAEQYLLLEAGHCTQNLLLQAAALGLGAVTIGAFDEGAVSRYLALPGGERPLYLIPTGHPA